MLRFRLEIALVLASAVLFGAMLGRHLSYPLLWADEAETAMFAQRVLEHGYPKVHGPRNVVYQFGPNIAVGVKEGLDAYIGTTWGQLYFAAPGLLWARGAADLYDKTFRVRLPFAVAGAAGVGLWLWALLPVFRGEPRRARRFAAAYLLLAALSLSLILHLREVRYYALVVLLAGAIARVHLGYSVFRRVGFRRWALELALLLFLLFNTFFQAFFAFGALLGIDRLLAIRRAEAGWRDLVPLLASALLVAPLLLFFETFSTAAAFGEAFSFRFGGYVSNLGTIAAHFLRHEFLVPALVCRAAVAATGAGSPEGRRVAARLLVFSAGYAAIGCLNPLALERYFVVLSPLVSGVFLLDAFALASALPARVAPARRRRAAAATVAALVALVLATRWPAFDDLRGRLAELGTPYRGPLDYVIPYLAGPLRASRGARDRHQLRGVRLHVLPRQPRHHRALAQQPGARSPARPRRRGAAPALAAQPPGAAVPSSGAAATRSSASRCAISTSTTSPRSRARASSPTRIASARRRPTIPTSSS